LEKAKIIDIHAHIFPEKIAEKAVKAIGDYYGIKMFGEGTCDALVESGKKINVYKYIVHSTATKVEQVKSINDFIADSAARYDSFIGFGTLHPGLENVDEEVDRIISLGLKGIKLHPEFQRFNIDDQDMLPIYKAAQGKLPILIHTGDENQQSSCPKKLAKIMDMFPDVVFIAAHFGGYSAWDESEKYLLGKNVYFDTSSSLFKLDAKRATEMIRRHGVEKMLFGTDYPMWDHKEELERFLKLDLTDDEREQILWKNAYRLLNIK
jgi:predicted TIM-barrel fold metal-dependent hydrolase